MFFNLSSPEDIPTKSAFCQARKKIKNTFYSDFFEKTCRVFYEYARPELLKGYRLWACDTTVQKLPDNEETKKLGTHTNQIKTVASIKVLTYYDALNQITAHASIHPKDTADLRCVQVFIKDIPNDIISVYDRGFASQLLAFLHTYFGSKYVIRVSTGFSNSVEIFMASDQVDVVVTELLSRKCFIELKKLKIRKSQHDTLVFRLVKVSLPGGETEVLMTNLEDSFSIDDLNLIYQKRWCVETSYNYIKNTWMLGTFSGYSQKAIIQGIYCVLIAHNLQTIIQYDCIPELEIINQKRTRKYKINRNVGSGIVRECVKKLFLNRTS